MKKLFVSLLRLGDAISLIPVLKAYHRQNPNDELHLLVNDGVQKIAPLVPFVAKIHIFDRSQIQEDMADMSTSVLQPFDMALKLVDELQDERFDSVVNLTHTKLSAFIVGTLDVEDKVGLGLNEFGGFEFGSSWFRFLNHHVAGKSGSIFHYNEIFANALNIGSAIEKKKPQSKNADVQKICIQTTTADDRKTFSGVQWKTLIDELSMQWPQSHISLLGAPNEAENLATLAQSAKQSSRVSVLLGSLEKTLESIKESDLCITVDTSIKHLAVLTDTPIVEIALGSSDIFKTGAFRENVLIVRSSVGCAPCAHEGVCGQPSHRCAENTQSEVVAWLAKAFVEKHVLNLRILAREFRTSVDVYQTRATSEGFWILDRLQDTDFNYLLNSLIEKNIWKVLAESSEHKSMEHGSLAREFLRQAVELVGSDNLGKVVQHLVKIESNSLGQMRDGQGLLQVLLTSLRFDTKMEGFKPVLRDVHSRTQNNLNYYFLKPHLEHLLKSKAKDTFEEFTSVRQLQQLLTDYCRFHEAKAKVLRSSQQIKTQEL